MMTSRLLWLTLLSAALLTLSGAVHADLYRWVDDQGKVHYSDTPPPPNAKKSKELPGPNRTDSPTLTEEKAQQPQSYIEKEAEFRKRQVENAERSAKQEQEKKDADAKKRRCETIRSELAGLQAGGRITRYNEQGERVFLDDAEIQQSIARAQKEIGTTCN